MTKDSHNLRLILVSTARFNVQLWRLHWDLDDPHAQRRLFGLIDGIVDSWRSSLHWRYVLGHSLVVLEVDVEVIGGLARHATSLLSCLLFFHYYFYYF